MIESRSASQGVSTDLSCLAASVAEGCEDCGGYRVRVMHAGLIFPKGPGFGPEDTPCSTAQGTLDLRAEGAWPPPTVLASPVVPVVHARSAESRSTGSLGVSGFLTFDR